ncbi:MAG: hypothetical protein WCX20_03165 [Candidatus Shapirobacteria bacterium]|jgi:hypothetical protein
MKKTQKFWLWISIAMFAIPELLFLTTPLTIVSFINNFSEIGINPPIYYIINRQFFVDHFGYVLLVMGIEILGVTKLLITSAKFKQKILTIVLAIFLLWLFIVFGVMNIFANISFS